MLSSPPERRWWPRLRVAAPVLLATVLALVGTLSLAPAASVAAPAELAAAPATACKSGSILFRDDFANPASGWPAGSDANGRWGYDRGEYLVAMTPGNQVGGYILRHPTQYTDFCAEVDARLASPTAQGYIMLAFRRQQTVGMGYNFIVLPDTRQYAVTRQIGGGGSPTALAALTVSTAINPGTAVNRLGVQAKGTQFVLFINGVAVQTVTDASFPGGLLGLGAGNLPGSAAPTGAAEGHFDNLVVRTVK